MIVGYKDKSTQEKLMENAESAPITRYERNRMIVSLAFLMKLKLLITRGYEVNVF